MVVVHVLWIQSSYIETLMHPTMWKGFKRRTDRSRVGVIYIYIFKSYLSFQDPLGPFIGMSTRGLGLTIQLVSNFPLCASPTFAFIDI